MRLGTMLCALALGAATAADAAPAQWVASWAAPPARPLLAAPPYWPNAPLTPSLHDQTVIQVVRLSAGGRRLRIRLSNEYGSAPLTIGEVRVAPLDGDGKPIEEAARQVTFSGSPQALIPAGAPLVSDPVDLPTGPLSRIRIGLYLPGETGPATAHFQALATAQISPPGDFADRPFTPVATKPMRIFLSEVDVERKEGGPLVVALGDSITDGVGSTLDADRRWPDVLAERLGSAGGAVVDAGIGGNQVLRDGVLTAYGQSALARFDRDVLSVPGATHLIVLEGINDISNPPMPTAEALIAGYRQMIARGHAHGLKVILGTIIPDKGAWCYSAETEAVRRAVNAWILSQHEADGTVDFDAAVRDPADPSKMRANLQSGDWLHPNDLGYRAMGEAIDLNLFR